MNLGKNTVIRSLEFQELGMFRDFIKEYWQKDHIFVKHPFFFDWQHKGSQTYNCMSAFQKGELVGVFCFIPLCHYDSRLSTNQIFMALFRALSDCEIGVGYRLYKSVLEEYEPEFIAGTTFSSTMIPYWKGQGFAVQTMDHYVALSPFLNNFKIAKVPKDLKIQFQEVEPEISFHKVSKKDLDEINSDGLYSHQWPLKSDTYIKNCYMNHPVYKYEVYAISKNNELLALCVIRPILIDNTVVLRFVDFVGSNEVFHVLNEFVMNIIKIYNAEYIDIYSLGIPSLLLQKAGFIKRKKLKGVIIPNYFEPIVNKNMDVICGYKTMQPQIPVRLFKADADLDRPSKI